MAPRKDKNDLTRMGDKAKEHMRGMTEGMRRTADQMHKLGTPAKDAAEGVKRLRDKLNGK